MSPQGTARIGLVAALAIGIAGFHGSRSQAQTPAPLANGSEARFVVPPAPQSHLLDQSGVFDAAQHERLSGLLVDAARGSGVDVYVATFTFIDGETIERRAERLKAEWCRGDFGLVLVFDRSTTNLTFSTKVHESMPVTVTEIEGLFRRANEAARVPGTPGEKIITLVGTLLPGLAEKVHVQQRLKREVVSRDQWLVFVAVAGALVFGSIAVLLVRRQVRRARRRRPAPVYFPSVTVESRFGGGYGGGAMAEVHFGRADQNARSSVRQ